MVPDYLEPLIGFRRWHCARGKLQAFYQDGVWLPGVNEATCHHGHSAPEPNCGCGLYAYFRLDDTKLLLGMGALKNALNQVRYNLKPGVGYTLGELTPKLPKPGNSYPAPLSSPYGGVGKASECGPVITGAVKMWGKVEAYETGARAQYAQVIGFLAGENNKLLKELSETYQVSIFSEQALKKLEMENPPRP